MVNSLSPTSRAATRYSTDPGVPLRSTPGFMLSPRSVREDTMIISNMDKIAALRRAMLFSELDDTALRSIAERAVTRYFRKDEVLFIAGEKAEGLYVIVSGSVRAFRDSVDGREQVIHVERAGGTVAEVPMFDDGNYPSTVAAEEETAALFLDKRDVRQLCLEHPEITLAALRVLAGRLRRCAELVETLSLKEVRSEERRVGKSVDVGGGRIGKTKIDHG